MMHLAFDVHASTKRCRFNDDSSMIDKALYHAAAVYCSLQGTGLNLLHASISDSQGIFGLCMHALVSLLAITLNT